jgi:DNA-binding CsgD family transcriptional regulator
MSAIRHLSANRASPTPHLVERDDELGVIEAAVAGVISGTGATVLLEADAGLGKTALLDHAHSRAAAALLRVRRAAPSRLERSFPFGVVRALLEEPSSALAQPRGPHVVDERLLAAIDLLAGSAVAAPQETAALAHSIYWLCQRLSADHPVVLLVDDAQWADRPSLEVMSYLARRIGDLRMLLVISAKASAPGPVHDLLGLMGVAHGTTVLRPQPLTPTGAVQLIHAVAPETPVSTCVDAHHGAAGNPWLLTELARQFAWREAAPVADPRTSGWSISGPGWAVIRQRLAELEPTARAVARALAILELSEPTPQVTAAAAGVPFTALPEARHALSAAGLLAPSGERLVHGFVAAAIRAALPPAERERLHRAAADALIENGAAPEKVAEHLLRCEPSGNPRVTAELRRAADHAAGRGAPAEAVSYLERAERERATDDEHGLILAELATAAFDAGLPGSRERLRESLQEAFLPTCRIDVLTRLAGLSVAENGDTELTQLIERELATQPDPDVRVAVEAAALDTLMVVPGRHEERRRRTQAIAVTTSTDPLLRQVVLAHRAWLATELGTPGAAACVALVQEALDPPLLLPEAWRRSAFHLCVRALVMCDAVPDARRAIAALRDEAAARGSLPLRTAAASYAAELALRTGDLDTATGEAQDALALAGEELGGFAGGALTALVCSWAEAGEFAHARELLGHRRFTRRSGPAPWDISVQHARARLALSEGDYERAEAEAQAAGVMRERQGRVNPTWTPWRSTAALALAHLGRREEAIALADTELALAERFGAPVPIVRALHARAVAEADDITRLALCTRALDLTADGSAALERVRVELELGATLASMGHRTEAREHLRPALAAADAIGAAPLVQRARRELVATGLRPRRAALEGEAALTPRQRQILALAAEGKTNKAIARALFVSVKTVETHLAAGYRKLGVRGRHELELR